MTEDKIRETFTYHPPTLETKESFMNPSEI